MPSAYHHPIQKLCSTSNASGASILLVAVGPYILSLDLKDGGVLSKWPSDPSTCDQAQTFQICEIEHSPGRFVNDGPEKKRRKVSPSLDNDELQARKDPGWSPPKSESVSERLNGPGRKQNEYCRSALPNVSHVICTIDGCHVIAVTVEDKCLRVFELDSSGHLELLSERQLTTLPLLFPVLTFV